MKGTEFVALLLVAFIVWELARSRSAPHAEVTLGEGTVIASDPAAQLGNDYTTSRPDDADRLMINGEEVPR